MKRSCEAGFWGLDAESVRFFSPAPSFGGLESCHQEMSVPLSTGAGLWASFFAMTNFPSKRELTVIIL